MVGTQHRSFTSFWNPTVKFYPHGILQQRANFSLPERTDKQVQSRRGCISSFSRHSALRLRKALLTYSLPDNLNCVMVGLTLTLPWVVKDGIDFDLVISDYKSAFNRFGVSFNRKFPNSSAIFRHELQTRKMPHCHLVFWLSDFDFHLRSKGRYSNLNDLRAIIHSLWSRSLFVDSFSSRYDCNLSGFSGHGVRVDVLNDSVQALRYICDHASKHKKSQLGYKGKQWGFLRRKMFVPVEPFEYRFETDDDLICFNRHVSKVCRYRINEKLSRRCCNKSVLFIAQSSVDRVAKSLLYDRTICKSYDTDKVFFHDLEISYHLWLSFHPGNSFSHFFSSSLINCLSCRDLFLWFLLFVRYS